MKQFIIYHSRSTDPLLAVQRIHARATARAQQIAKAVAVTDVDVDTSTGTMLKCYSHAGTIECATADGACKERQKNPSASAIDGMVDRV